MHRGCFLWTPTPPLAGRRTPHLGPVRVCVCLSVLAGSGGPASRAPFGVPHPFLWPLCLSALVGPLSAGVAPFLVLCLPPCPLFFLFLLPRASFVSCFLWFPAPGPLGLGALVFFPLPPGLWFFFPFFSFFSISVRPLCLWLSLVSGPGCPGPWRCVMFVLLASRFSALPALSPRLCFPPRRWLLPGGCCPLPLFCLAVFVTAARCSVLFSLSFVVRPRSLWLSPVSGPGCPGPRRCVLFVMLASRFWACCALSPLLCFPPGHWLLAGGCCPPPPLCLTVSVAPARCWFFFPSFVVCPCCLWLSLLSGPGCPGPWRCVLFVLLPFCFSALRALSPLLCFRSGRWLLPGGCCLPRPLLCLAVFLAAARCSVFFLLLCPCLLAWRSSAVLAACCPPLPQSVRRALCCLVLPRCAALPSGVFRCCVAVFRAECRAVVPGLALLVAAARCAVFVWVFVCVWCCAVVCCCVLCRVSGRAVRLGCSRCGLLSGFGLRCRVLCCAVCPRVRCCAALLRVVPPGVVVLCAVLFCCARLVPLLVVPCPLALPVALGPCALRRCALRCSPALSAPCCVCFGVACWCVLVFAAVLCAVCVLGCRAARFLSSLLCAVPCFAVLVRLRCVCGACCCWRLMLWCAAVCCAVSLGVLWCGAASAGPWLSAGGVFRCRCPCLAAWSASLWLVWFAVAPCFPVSFSVVLSCRFAVLFVLALPFCGLSCCAVLCCWLSVLFFAQGWCLCAVVPFPSLPARTKRLIITLCYPAPVSVTMVHVAEESGLAIRRCVADPRGCL